MSDDFYPFVDSGDPTPSNTHLTGAAEPEQAAEGAAVKAARISVYDDMLSTPRVIVVEQGDIRTYLEDVTNTVYRTMKEQGGHLTLMIIRELVENYIHAQFSEPIISILDNGDTIRFSDQGPGIGDKELAFEFGVTSADREQKRYIRGTGSGLPMIQQYVENAGGAIAIEDNLGAGTVVTVSVNPDRVCEIEQSVSRGAAVRSGGHGPSMPNPHVNGGTNSQTWAGGAESYGQYAQAPAQQGYPVQQGYPAQQGYFPQQGSPAAGVAQPYPQGGMPQPMQQGIYPQPQSQPYGYPQFGNQFSTIPQQYAQPAGMYPSQPVQQPAAMPNETPYISERGIAALRFIWENTSGGPTDLTRAYGSSNGTWSRELATLSKAGLVHKPGQKYVLTDAGRAWMQQHNQ